MYNLRPLHVIALITLILCGCLGDTTVEMDPVDVQDSGTTAPDQSVSVRDMFNTVDMSRQDMSSEDMFVGVDMAVDMDMTVGVDTSSMPADLGQMMDASAADLGDMASPQDMAQPGPWHAFSGSWVSVDLGAAFSQPFSVSFEMEADADQIDAVIGVGPQIATQYDDLASNVRLSNVGEVDVRSGDDYVPLMPTLSYNATQPVQVRLDIDPQARSYSITTISQAGSTHDRGPLSFRTSQQQVSALQYLSVYASDGSASIRDLRVNGGLVPWVPVAPPVVRLMDADLNSMPLKGFGTMTRADLGMGFGNVVWSSEEEHLAVVDEPGQGRVLRVKYDPKDNGSDRVAFRVDLPPGDERWLSYRIQFEPGFEFVKGGKLPGLAGGTSNTGGNKPNGTDGYTSRYMWRRNGDLVVYLYHPDQPTIYGEDFDHVGLTLQTGQWYTVRQRVVMNTNNQRNGVLETWVDGVPYLAESIRLRSQDDAFQIDSFLFSTFYGGSDPSWAPSQTTYIRFDDFKIADSQFGVD